MERRLWDFSSGVAIIGLSLFPVSAVFPTGAVVVLLAACNILLFFAQCSFESMAHTHTHSQSERGGERDREREHTQVYFVFVCLLTLLLLLLLLLLVLLLLSLFC